MGSAETVFSFLVAVLLGFLIGLERERKREARGSIFAGVRTFPLIALFGAVSGRVADATSVWIVPAAFVTFGALLVLSYWRASAGEKVGGTTEVAALVALGLGALAGFGEFVPALAGGVMTTAVLSLREELRRLVGGLTRDDLFAVVQFAAVSLVILPLVPDADYGPWGVWNPRAIWLLVVLISGVSFVGYGLAKLVGARRSIGVTGLVGGLASSTAVTLSFSERSRATPALGAMLAAGVLAATAVSMVRVLVLVGVIRPALVVQAWPPLAAYALVVAVGGWLVYRRSDAPPTEGAPLTNPFELRTALTFAALFALILLVTRAAQAYLGTGGVYLASALGGLTQLDAISLTLARQAGQGLEATAAVRGLALALLGNSVFKVGLGFALGAPGFARRLAVVAFLAALAALAAAWLLPPGWSSALAPT